MKTQTEPNAMSEPVTYRPNDQTVRLTRAQVGPVLITTGTY